MINTPTPELDIVLVGRRFKTRRTVPVVVEATLILIGRNELRTKFELELDCEDRVSSQTLERAERQDDGIAGIVPTTTGRTF